MRPGRRIAAPAAALAGLAVLAGCAGADYDSNLPQGCPPGVGAARRVGGDRVSTAPAAT